MVNKKILFIPVWGPIILYVSTNKTLKNTNSFSFKRSVLYLFIMGVLGLTSQLIAAHLTKIFSPGSEVLFRVLSIFLMWILLPLPVLKYVKEAEELVKKKDHSPSDAISSK